MSQPFAGEVILVIFPPGKRLPCVAVIANLLFGPTFRWLHLAVEPGANFRRLYMVSRKAHSIGEFHREFVNHADTVDLHISSPFERAFFVRAQHHLQPAPTIDVFTVGGTNFNVELSFS